MATLPPTRPRTSAPSAAPGLGRMLSRALLRRCPWCGDWKAWFRGYLGKNDRCRRCGLRWDRSTDGQELGAMVINLILTIGVLAVGFVAVAVATAPDLPVAPLIVVFVVLGCLAPVVFYPISFTVYHAIDLRVRPPQPPELADAAAWLFEQQQVVTTSPSRPPSSSTGEPAGDA